MDLTVKSFRISVQGQTQGWSKRCDGNKFHEKFLLLVLSRSQPENKQEMLQHLNLAQYNDKKLSENDVKQLTRMANHGNVKPPTDLSPVIIRFHLWFIQRLSDIHSDRFGLFVNVLTWYVHNGIRT